MSNIKKFRIKSFKKNTAILELDKISLKFGRKMILDNLSLKLNSGQVLGLLCPNGAGKTTIFNLICGLLTPDFGSIIINSELVNKYPIYQRTLKFKIGFVPQYGGYFHDLTVYENLKAIAEITINNISSSLMCSRWDFYPSFNRKNLICQINCRGVHPIINSIKTERIITLSY